MSETNESDCNQPCDPDLENECCASYWERMVDEGFWDMESHRWTDKGWKEMLK